MIVIRGAIVNPKCDSYPRYDSYLRSDIYPRYHSYIQRITNVSGCASKLFLSEKAFETPTR